MESSKSILPVEICAQIAQHARMSDLPALARVSKPLQVLAETRLYQHIVMRDPPSVYRISISLLARDHQRALYVKRLWVYQDHRASRSPWPEDLWDVVRKVLNALHNLESAYLYDESSTNTWLFDPARIPFQLREANLGFHWDDALMSFLEGQKDLQVLTLQMPEDDEITHRTLSRDALPKVELFDGPLFVALDLRFRPLRRLNIRVDEETVPLFSIYLAELALVNRTLRSLNVQNVPEYLVADSLRVLASSPLAESMRYLGILNLPAAERNDIHRSLLKFKRLEVMQVDLSHWTPAPMFSHLPMIASELRTYCFSLRSFTVWVNAHQFFGRYENERWIFQQLPGPRYPGRDSQWREY